MTVVLHHLMDSRLVLFAMLSAFEPVYCLHQWLVTFFIWGDSFQAKLQSVQGSLKFWPIKNSVKSHTVGGISLIIHTQIHTQNTSIKNTIASHAAWYYRAPCWNKYASRGTLSHRHTLSFQIYCRTTSPFPYFSSFSFASNQFSIGEWKLVYLYVVNTDCISHLIDVTSSNPSHG